MMQTIVMVLPLGVAVMPYVLELEEFHVMLKFDPKVLGRARRNPIECINGERARLYQYSRCFVHL